MKQLLLIFSLPLFLLASCAKKQGVDKGKTESNILFAANGNGIIHSMDATPDGGCILAIEETPNLDGVILKTDINGNQIWKKRYGGTGYNNIYSVHPTADGGYIACGSTNSKGNANKFADAWILKLNEKGEVEWDTTYGNIADDCFYEVCQTKDNYFYAAGYSSGCTFFALKIDAKGKQIGPSMNGNLGSVCDIANSVTINPFNGNVFFTREVDDRIMAITERKATGGNLFVGQYDYAIDSGSPHFHSNHYFQNLSTVRVIAKPDGYLIGRTLTYSGKSAKIVLMQTDGFFTAKIKWTKSYYLLGNTCLNDMRDDEDGGYIITGGSTNQEATGVYGNFKGKNAFVMKTDNIGKMLWVKYFGSAGNASNGLGIIKRGSQGYLVAGNTVYHEADEIKTFFLKINKKGEVE
ncbi:MAG: hypothetical protein NTX03_03325 [Bacteroidetes bacterium]|nr:hypothetical protein [Bacteroidota bacterium]